jgi:DNA repair protein RadD
MLWSIKLDGNDICVLPTGAGKSVVIAKLAEQLDRPLLILQPSKEILDQNYKKLLQFVSKEDIGIFSASFQRNEIRKYTFATIQSIYKKPELFTDFGVVIIDECHLVNPKNLDGMFTSFLKAIGNPKVFGFTATPYRMETTYKWVGETLVAGVGLKLICRMKPFFWSRIIFNIQNQDLIEQGYLCPLTYLDKSLFTHAELPTNKSGSDFDLEKVEKRMYLKKDEMIEIINSCQERFESCLVFCTSINQAEMLNENTKNSFVVTGSTPPKVRDQIIDDFKTGKIHTVFNVGVLTTGFDFPELYCIVLLRPTQSLALYYQMLGRGVRISPGKKTCHVVDLTSTVRKLGRVESIRLDKVDNGKWDIVTETGQWHNKTLYEYELPPKKEEPENLF